LFTLASSPEIVKLRESNLASNVTEEPEFEDPGYRALVEENVKESVSNIANDPVMQAVCLFLCDPCARSPALI
jgi:carbonic anhydrase